MRILRVAQKLYPEVKGGGPYHVHAMSRDQAAMGHDVTVVAVRTDPTAPALEERDGYTVVRYDPTATVLGNGISAGVARHLWHADGFDVIHAHSHLYFSTNLAAVHRLFDDVPLAITNHGLFSQTVSERVFDLYLRTVGRWTFNRADLTFCYTAADERRLREYGTRSPIEIVPNGVDTARFTPEGPTSEAIDGDGPAVLFVGRLVEGKHPQDVIRLLEPLTETFPGVTAYFCGDGPLRPDLEALAASLGVRDHVRFLGHVSYDEMPAIYRSADVFVLPSRSEGIPRTVLESFASGVPAVASALDHIESVVAVGGETAPVGDVDAFAAAVERLLSDPEYYSELSARGREYVTTEATWDRTVALTTDHLDRLARRCP
ncbi:glycosyltransferase family 4 protein [Natrononativus amylolyticus]|uniref:glycosyltransferase family 4 protein n=1 Tax=Natrononativus amylolyticus TaxID=2963434 RepID=UPI0020CB7726|nr:glycosyltransferase family 4 protein [Natrononativus amylolyticus]